MNKRNKINKYKSTNYYKHAIIATKYLNNKVLLYIKNIANAVLFHIVNNVSQFTNSICYAKDQ